MSDSSFAPEEPTPPFALMKQHISRAAGLLKEARIPPGSAAMAIRGFRKQLAKIYGEDAPQLAHFPVLGTDLPSEQIREQLSQSVTVARHILATLADLTTTAAASIRGKSIFIGHGRSPLWRELKDFITERLHLPWDEFNREPVAGYATTERLQAMMDQSAFALLVMTAEEEHADARLHARPNVVHEVGLFQGRLGLRRAIVLLEEGCAEFSNIVGLSQIRFPPGDIAARFEDIRRVLEREGLV